MNEIMMTTESKDKVCSEILEIMAEWHRQGAKGYVSTPGGFEHMGDVWRKFLNWEEQLKVPELKETSHLPDCDINDHNPDGIRKPCNCGIGFNTDCPSAEHHEKPTLCPDCQAKQETIDKLRQTIQMANHTADYLMGQRDRLRKALEGMVNWTDLQLYQYHSSYREAAEALRETKP